MPGINIQFYALQNELFPIIEEWKHKFGIQLVIMEFFQEGRIFEIESFSHFDDDQIKKIDCVFLGLNTPKITVKNRYDFLEKNPDFIAINIGKLTKDGLEESFFSGTTDNSTVYSIWNKVAGHLKRITYAGAWAINNETGNKHFYKDIRYTSGACNLSQNGTKLLTNASFVYCFIDSKL